jgi:hypothetical protein
LLQIKNSNPTPMKLYIVDHGFNMQLAFSGSSCTMLEVLPWNLRRGVVF